MKRAIWSFLRGGKAALGSEEQLYLETKFDFQVVFFSCTRGSLAP